jgi:phage terminase small subunit
MGGALITQPVENLTELEEKFVDGLFDGLSATEAARNAGYGSPGTEGPRIARRPRVQLALRTALLARVDVELTPLALDTLRDTLNAAPEQVSHSVKIKAAETILRFSSLAKQNEPKAPEELEKSRVPNMDDLKRVEAMLNQVIAEMSKPMIELDNSGPARDVDNSLRPPNDIENDEAVDIFG